MAKSEWSGLTDGQIAKRLGRALGLVFAEGAPVGLGGMAFGITEVGEDRYVALEVETKHTHPAENVLRYWPWLERTRRRVVLVHAIAPDARKRESPRADLTKWLGAMMERVIPGRFTYCRVELGSPHQEEQLAAVRDAIDALATSAHERKLAPGL
jgi:hypothetical protein